jgi:hypothetical protein
MTKCFYRLTRLLAFAGLASLLSACDDSPENSNLLIEPEGVTLTNGTSVVFTVIQTEGQEIFFPLEWQVGNSSLGIIAEQKGLSAVYAPVGGAGFNVITVNDQGDGEGVARIDQ